MVKVAASTKDASSRSSKAPFSWRPTKIMNMRDLSKDDDFLSHLLVEKLGTGAVPLLVHKMDSSRRFPKTDAADLLRIVRRLVISKSTIQQSTRQAVDDLLLLSAIRYYIKDYTQKQINAFSTHASRYFELYNPAGVIEIAHTSRYAHRTGKSELCILATRKLIPGTVITELKGSMADLTDEEDKELKRTDLRSCEVRRDFSVIHSRQMKKNHLFLGPARFVNHDCGNNCELFREGRYITFRVIKPIMVGEEITAHYGDGYFGRNNRHCLCETCEKAGRGGYSPNYAEEIAAVVSSGSDSDSDTSSSEEEDQPTATEATPVNVNERRTRRGVYAVVQDEIDSGDSEDDESGTPSVNLQDFPVPGPADAEIDQIKAPESTVGSSMIPTPRRLSSPDLTPSPSKRNKSVSSTPSFRSIISTRRQKAEKESSSQQRDTPSDSTPRRRTSSRLTSLLSSRSESVATSSHKGNEKADELTVKKEDADVRVLRTRPAAASSNTDVSKPSPDLTQIPIGPDGKPLPTCATCFNILPLISVDSQVVWGLVEGSLRNRKKQKPQDCPRCMRHADIYGQPWPHRVAPRGATFPSSTAENTPTLTESSTKPTRQSISVVVHKLAAVAAARGRRESNDEDEPPSKRRKIGEDLLPKVRPSKVDAHVGSTAASSRLRDSSIASNPATKHSSSSVTPAASPRRRGRPSKSITVADGTQISISPAPNIKSEDDDSVLVMSISGSVNLKAEAVKDQPRDGNGRFGKKDKYLESSEIRPRATLSRAERHLEREKMKERAEAEKEMESPSRKRWHRDSVSNDEESRPHKRLHFTSFSPAGTTFSFKMGLCNRPNPLSYSRRTWSQLQDDSDAEEPVSLVDDTTTSEESDGPVTPNEHSDLSPAPVIIDVDVVSGEEKAVSPLLTMNPTPFTYARRRWKSSTPTHLVKSPSHTQSSLPETSISRTVFDALIDSPDTTSQRLRRFPVLDEDNANDAVDVHKTRSVFSVLSKEYTYPLSWVEKVGELRAQELNLTSFSKQIKALADASQDEMVMSGLRLSPFKLPLIDDSDKSYCRKQCGTQDMVKVAVSGTPHQASRDPALKLVNAAWEYVEDDM